MKCVVSLSGGRDSATCLGLAVDKYGAENVYAIGFDYGSTHTCELYAAKEIAKYYNVPYRIIKIDPSIFEGSACTMLEGAEEKIEKGKSYEEILAEKEGKVSTYVPARNTLFSAYVLAIAESTVQKYNEDVIIMLGQHADDSGFYIDENGEEHLDYTKAAYPDCSVEFVEAFANVARISSVNRVHYATPFVKMHKWELIKEGLTYKKPVPYHLCFSCYDPIWDENTKSWKEDHSCATCIDVKKAYDRVMEEISKTRPDLIELTKKELIW